jgi:hypothetical protein
MMAQPLITAIMRRCITDYFNGPPNELRRRAFGSMLFDTPPQEIIQNQGWPELVTAWLLLPHRHTLRLVLAWL